jgi:hypothetical protein
MASRYENERTLPLDDQCQPLPQATHANFRYHHADSAYSRAPAPTGSSTDDDSDTLLDPVTDACLGVAMSRDNQTSFDVGEIVRFRLLEQATDLNGCKGRVLRCEQIAPTDPSGEPQMRVVVQVFDYIVR